MAKLVDNEPQYEGEKKVWNLFGSKLPSNWVVYNNRSVNGREYDICVIAPEFGLFIVEVKGWSPAGVLTVVSQNTIIIEGNEKPEDSPRSQARGYRFDLLKKIQKELGMNPLVMSLVCYPFISKKQYLEKGLNVVSEENETIFAEELDDTSLLFQKFMDRYNVDKGVKHDDLSAKRFALIRHHFEPNYDFKSDEEVLNPGYSRLRIFANDINEQEVRNVVEEYFSGIKEIVFVPSAKSMNLIIDELKMKFQAQNIYPIKADLCIGRDDSAIKASDSGFSIFNFEIEVVPNLTELVEENILVEEGECVPEVRKLLRTLSDVTSFNYQQYEIEHAPCDRNILVTAGAGTGKTYSMVSRIAFLCNKNQNFNNDSQEFEGGIVADNMAAMIAGSTAAIDLSKRIEVTEFDNQTEFAGYVAKKFENASHKRENDEFRHPALYYMDEQIYAANSGVNQILKIYFPEQFGEREFLDYPIGHFFISVTNMWDPESNVMCIKDLAIRQMKSNAWEAII